MNKVRIFGVILIIAGVAAKLILENDKFAFIYALAIGLGIGLSITGKVKGIKS